MKYCANCNTQLNKKAKFCPECGTVVISTEEDNVKSTKSKFTVTVLSVLLILLLVIGGLWFAFSQLNQTDWTNSIFTVDFSDNPEEIAKTAKSVVKLNCYNDAGELISTGSGFAALEKGVIVTNYHVIESYPARIEIVTELGEKCDIFGGIGVSAERDIAILYYRHEENDFELPLLSIDSSKMLTKGEKVVAIGSPLGLTNTISAGVFSGYTNIGSTTDIQFTASISSGSSGGALFNNKGHLIGITYATLAAGQNINLAVPIEFVESLWKAESSNKSELSSFYETIIPHYSIAHTLLNYKTLENSVFYLDCKISSYDDFSNGFVAHCTDEHNTLKAIYYGQDTYWAKKMVELMVSNDKGIKCIGTDWSEKDNKPYVIIK